MTDITITNQLAEAFTVYDSYQTTDADDNYYGTLTELSPLAASGNISIPPPHPISTLIVFDDKSKPLTRLTAGLSHYQFTISQTDVQAMAQAAAFVAYVGRTRPRRRRRRSTGSGRQPTSTPTSSASRRTAWSPRRPTCWR